MANMNPLSKTEIDGLMEFAHELADSAARVILPYFRQQQDVENKATERFDPVTKADQLAEMAMRKLILERFPDHGVLGEELGQVSGHSNYFWVLDPIDGTRAFITGLPLWGSLIALNDGHSPILGMMNQPYTGERFFGTRSGAWMGDKPLSTKKCASIQEAVVMCTTPEMFSSKTALCAFEAVACQARMLRYGGDCYAYCMLASGLVDIIIEDDLKPYDVQALIPIIEGAGGRITTWDGGDAQHGGAIVATGDPRRHQDVLNILMQSMRHEF